MEKAIENMDRKRLGILIRCLVILLITGVTNSAAVFVSPLAKPLTGPQTPLQTSARRCCCAGRPVL